MYTNLTASRGRTPSALTAILPLAVVLLLASCGPLASLDQTAAPERVEETLTPEQRLRKYMPSHASDFLGKQYVYGAKGPNTFDCSGFTSHVLREFGITLLGSSMSQAKQGRAVLLADAQPGDIVYFQNASGRVNHVALVVANSAVGLEVVHATTSRGVVRDNITTSSYWAPRLAGARCVVDCRSGLAAAF